VIWVTGGLTQGLTDHAVDGVSAVLGPQLLRHVQQVREQTRRLVEGPRQQPNRHQPPHRRQVIHHLCVVCHPVLTVALGVPSVPCMVMALVLCISEKMRSE
jgi:hypothetical protein